MAEIVKVDVAATGHRAAGAGRASQRWPPAVRYQVRLLALHVRHRAERETCTKIGFELFAGYRFTAPETLTRRDLPIGQVQAFRLFNMVRDAEDD